MLSRFLFRAPALPQGLHMSVICASIYARLCFAVVYLFSIPAAMTPRLFCTPGFLSSSSHFFIFHRPAAGAARIVTTGLLVCRPHVYIQVVLCGIQYISCRLGESYLRVLSVFSVPYTSVTSEVELHMSVICAGTSRLAGLFFILVFLVSIAAP